MVLSVLSLAHFPLTILELTVSRDVVVKPPKIGSLWLHVIGEITLKFGQLFS